GRQIQATSMDMEMGGTADTESLGHGKAHCNKGRNACLTSGFFGFPVLLLSRLLRAAIVISSDIATETADGNDADHQSIDKEIAAGAAQPAQAPRHAGLPAEKGCVPASKDHDPQEAELGPAQGGPRAAIQRDRSHGLYSRRRP